MNRYAVTAYVVSTDTYRQIPADQCVKPETDLACVFNPEDAKEISMYAELQAGKSVFANGIDLLGRYWVSDYSPEEGYLLLSDKPNSRYLHVYFE